MTMSAPALEVLVVPNTAAAGFLNSYVWTIPLTADEAAQLISLAAGSLLRRQERARFIRRLVRRHGRKQGLPPLGVLSDYHVDFSRVYLRLQLQE